jgi:hypothetical protein
MASLARTVVCEAAEEKVDRLRHQMDALQNEIRELVQSRCALIRCIRATERQAVRGHFLLLG